MLLRKIVYFFIAAAVFSLMLHRDTLAVKPFDVLILAAGILALFERGFRRQFRELWPHVSGYVWPLLLLLLFIIAGGLAGNPHQPNAAFSPAAIKNYARIIFDGAVFLFLAFAVWAEKKTLKYMSAVAFFSSVVVLPAYWNYTEGVFIDGGRLAGYLQTPIIFGMYMMVIYLVGLGLFLRVSKLWQKIAVTAWLAITANFILWAASRASWLGLTIALSAWLFILIKRKNYAAAKWFLSAIIVSFLLGLLFIPHNENLHVRGWIIQRAATAVVSPLKNQEQTQTWSYYSTIVRQNPLSVGFNNLSPNSTVNNLSPNSTVLEIWLDGGLGALFAALFFLLKILRDMKNAVKNLIADMNYLELAWILGGAAVLIDIFFTDGLFLRHAWAILGIAVGASWSAILPQSASEQ